MTSVKVPADVEKADLTVEEEQGADESDVAPISWKNWLNLAAYVVNIGGTGIFGGSIGDVSNKYQTLVAPAGWAFSIWGPIFIWEFVFVVAQMFPQFRNTNVVLRMSPWWWVACLCQAGWVIAWVQELVTLALVLMLSILVSLLGIAWTTDGLHLTIAEYFLLRAPLSLHLAWIMAASAVNVNLQADATKAGQETLLAVAIVSFAVLLAVSTFFTFAVRSPDPFVAFVTAWAFAAIHAELGNPDDLNDPTRFNPSVWDPVILGGLQKAALIICLLALSLGVVATALKIFKANLQSKEAAVEEELDSEADSELSDSL